MLRTVWHGIDVSEATLRIGDMKQSISASRAVRDSPQGQKTREERCCGAQHSAPDRRRRLAMEISRSLRLAVASNFAYIGTL